MAFEPLTVVIVTGGRDYKDYTRVAAVLDEVKPDVIFHGAADGADHLADIWAWRRCVCIRIPAQWDKHGKRAGPIRNTEMLGFAEEHYHRHGHQLIGVAFPGGRGTADMVSKMKAHGHKVREETT